jgi:hypothetical protein
MRMSVVIFTLKKVLSSSLCSKIIHRDYTNFLLMLAVEALMTSIYSHYSLMLAVEALMTSIYSHFPLMLAVEALMTSIYSHTGATRNIRVCMNH